MQSGVGVVRVFVNGALRELACCPFVMELGGHLGAALIDSSDARLHGAEALAVRVERRLHSGALIEQARHLLRQSADLIRDNPDSLNRLVEVIANIRVVIVLDFLIRALRSITGLRRGLRDMREPRVEQPADVP